MVGHLFRTSGDLLWASAGVQKCTGWTFLLVEKGGLFCVGGSIWTWTCDR